MVSCSECDAGASNLIRQRNWSRRLQSLFYRIALSGVAASSLLLTGTAVWIHENNVIGAMNGGELSPGRGLALMALGMVPLMIHGIVFRLARETCNALLDNENLRESRLQNAASSERSKSPTARYEATIAPDAACCVVMAARDTGPGPEKNPTALKEQVTGPFQAAQAESVVTHRVMAC
ncbi:hypothetical protein ANPL_00250 [Anaplasma platys]|uniref:Uncharacterized protein n=1 Tax=Anaplasma platys TaxID=949 RepID=A0A858PX66_9RICK|nr:hypothetical protein ANPL_00250 [Anaplasma platys]